MKANQKFLKKNERGDVGLGTLIIFIAMVLTAAVAATVLIYTTGSLMQKATKTSKEATQQVSSNIVVEQVIGDRSASLNNNIQDMLIRIKPDVGTSTIDLSVVIVSLQDASNRADIYSNSTNSSSAVLKYSAKAIRDEDESFPVINSGDLIEIKLNQTSLSNMTLTPRKTFFISVSLERGQSQTLEITTPSSFGVSQYITLYP
jgi:flagellin FlaB